jgi:hypothetical protein
MSSNTETALRPFAGAQPTSSGSAGGEARRWSYSRKRWNAFDAWQEHVRKYAATVGTAFTARPDRDLRRTIVAG